MDISLSIFKKKNLPYNLKKPQYLIPKYNNFDNFNYPINFELVEKNLFEPIIKDLNTQNNINLKINQCYDVLLGDKKIFVQDNTNKKINFFSSFDYEKYELEYIIDFYNENFFNFININNDKKSFEEIISEYGIDLTEKYRQPILNSILDITGMLINIKSKPNIPLREPKHFLGLENIGEPCCLNATMQCLSHISNIKKYFKNRKLVFNDINSKNCPLTRDICYIINNLWKKSYNGKNYFTLRFFIDTLSKMNLLFKNIIEEDIKDLIIFIYETIHNEINNPAPYNETYNYFIDQDLLKFRNNYYSNNSSFLIKTSYFEQQNEIRCMNCNFSKISYNISNIIIFPLEKVREYLEKKIFGFISVTLENCFENYQEPEMLFGQNQIYCNSCNCLSNAVTANKIFTSPEVLTIILYRGEFNINFEYPLFLDIDKYIMDKSQKNNKYELICVLAHLGPSKISGNFIAFCKSPVDKQWYCYNDENVSECSEPRFQNNNENEVTPYVLFYQKCNHGIFEKNNSNNSHINYINNNISYSNGFKNEGKQDNNSITLYFNYNEKELPLFLVQRKKKISPSFLVNELRSNFDYIPENILLFIQIDDEVLNLEDYLTDNKLKDGDKIIIVENDL